MLVWTLVQTSPVRCRSTIRVQVSLLEIVRAPPASGRGEAGAYSEDTRQCQRNPACNRQEQGADCHPGSPESLLASQPGRYSAPHDDHRPGLVLSLDR